MISALYQQAILEPWILCCKILREKKHSIMYNHKKKLAQPD